MSKKKKRNTSTFLKNYPDFFVFEQKIKKTPINNNESEFLNEIWLWEYKWRDEDNIFNHIY